MKLTRRYLLPFILTGLFGCDDPYPQRQCRLPEEESLQDSLIRSSPTFYTDFDITDVDSVSIAEIARYYAESSGPYFVIIDSKKLLPSGEFWSFTLSDSLDNWSSYYFRLKNKSDSVMYDYGINEGEDIFLMDSASRNKIESEMN